MALASSSKLQIAFLEESVLGTVASGAPRLLRFTGESLNFSVSRATSAEINSTRQTPDSTNVDASVEGALNIELVYREYDPLLEALLASTYTTDFGTDGVATMLLDFNATANTITDSDTGGGFVGFDDIVDGQWIMIKDAGVNTKLYKVASTSGAVATIAASTPVVSTVAGVTAEVSGARLSNGTAAQRGFTLQKNFTDVAQFFVFRGCSVSQLQLSFETGAILTGSINFMGRTSAQAAVTYFTAPATAATAFGVMNAVAGVGSILVDGVALAGTYVKSASININAALRGQKALGNLGNVGIGEGTFEMGGNLTIYLNDATLYNTALADTYVSLEIPVLDAYNNGYVFIFNNIKLAVPTVPASGKDQDVMLSMDFTAHAPSTATDKMIIIDRVGDAAA